MSYTKVTQLEVYTNFIVENKGGSTPTCFTDGLRVENRVDFKMLP